MLMTELYQITNHSILHTLPQSHSPEQFSETCLTKCPINQCSALQRRQTGRANYGLTKKDKNTPPNVPKFSSTFEMGTLFSHERILKHCGLQICPFRVSIRSQNFGCARPFFSTFLRDILSCRLESTTEVMKLDLCLKKP